jgi:hypothetical protein
MLVIRDDPQIDLLVKIAYGPCWGGTVVFEVRKNELGHWEEVSMSGLEHWEEKDVFFPTSCPAEVNLSVPDQITVDYPDDDRRLVALGVEDYLTLGDAAFAGVEVGRSCGVVWRFFTVLALSSARSGALPGADRDLWLCRDDSMAMALSDMSLETGIEELQPVRVFANEIVFQDKDGDEVIFERQKYRVAIRRGRSEPITGYLWMVREHGWTGIEFCQREGSQEKLPSFLWMLPECEIPFP